MGQIKDPQEQAKQKNEMWRWLVVYGTYAAASVLSGLKLHDAMAERASRRTA